MDVSLKYSFFKQVCKSMNKFFNAIRLFYIFLGIWKLTMMYRGVRNFNITICSTWNPLVRK